MKSSRERIGLPSCPPHDLRRIARTGLLVLALGALGSSFPLVAQVGATFGELPTRSQAYSAVKVLSATPSAITIRHAGGIAQVPLRDLPEDVQARFGYDAAGDAAHQKAIAEASAAQLAAAAAKAKAEAAKPARGENRSSRAAALFGKPAPLQPVDLRGEYRGLNYTAKEQGRRPSCAIYSVIGALELESSRATGRLERLSEDYLIWATLQSTGRSGIQGRTVQETEQIQRFLDDIGFSLAQVLAAARRYGVALDSEMPTDPDARMTGIRTPDRDVVDRAQHYRRIVVHDLATDGSDRTLDNIRHLLHAGVPVLAGVYWPPLPPEQCVTITNGTPSFGGGHAITLVGYTCATGKREDIKFIYRNSWGRDWGDDGYGTIEYGYLRQNLGEAAVIEVMRSATAAR